MKSTHTPGPWVADWTTSYNGQERQGWFVRDGKNVEFHIELPNGTSAEANARLIAAAPDLLDALHGMLKRYTELVNCGDCGHWNPEEEQPVINGRNAIAKATSEKEAHND